MNKVKAAIYSKFIARHQNTSSNSWKIYEGANLKEKTIEQFLNQSLYDDLITISSDTQFNAQIRQIRNAAMIKIATEDIENFDALNHLEETMNQVSFVARYLIDVSYQRSYQKNAEIYGAPMNEDGSETPLIILALGKLGASELNFSSDVDLIFCYQKEGETQGARKISFFEFFSKVGQRTINYLNSIFEDGFVFRVDMRLRPFGESGALVSSFSALENYYQIHGRDWERYALIKASHIQSHILQVRKQQEVLMKQFNQIIKPFIYRRFLDFSVFESLRDMKTLIDAESKVSTSENHIKLGFGGIRLIEFIVQSFQLIYAGRYPNLQTNSLKTTLFSLKDLGLISAFKVDELWQAYCFLRVVENRLQQRNDMQVHQLFSNQEELLLLSQSIGFETNEDFFKVLDVHRHRVQSYFDTLFNQKTSSEMDSWRKIWLTGKDKAVMIEQMKAEGKEDFLFLAESLFEAKKLLSGSGVNTKLSNNFRTFIPIFMGVIEYYYYKHLNLHKDVSLEEKESKKVFERVMLLVRRTFISNVYLVMFNENRDLIKRICRTARASAMLMDILSKNPFLIDQLLDRESLYQLFNPQKVFRQINHQYKGDLNEEMEFLRVFNHKRLLSVAMLDVMKSLPLSEVSNQLTYVTEGILKRVMHCAWLDVAPKFSDLNLEIGEDFSIIACGKFGGLEMSYNSDLDLIFLCRDQKHLVFFTRLVQRMIHMLEITTNTGKLFNIDLRLRPNGSTGALVNPINDWFEYEKNQAWVWEHQILCRSRVVAGDDDMAIFFNHLKKRILVKKRDEGDLKNEVISMRQKMKASLDLSKSTHFDLKQGSGGIVDIEFLVQYLLLNHAYQYPELIKFSDNLRQIETLIDCKIIKAKVGNQLIECYFSLREKIHQLVLENQPVLIEPEKVAKETQFVIKLWKKYLD